MEASDAMICNSRAFNLYKDQKTNDLLYMQQMNAPQATQLKNLRHDYKLKVGTDPKLYICSEAMRSRGGNAAGCEGQFVQGYAYYTKYHLNDFLLAPCQTNTWRNHIACDQDKCCEIKHQLFGNWTKRK